MEERNNDSGRGHGRWAGGGVRGGTVGVAIYRPILERQNSLTLASASRSSAPVWVPACPGRPCRPRTFEWVDQRRGERKLFHLLSIPSELLAPLGKDR